jgi:hypothetical protein
MKTPNDLHTPTFSPPTRACLAETAPAEKRGPGWISAAQARSQPPELDVGHPSLDLGCPGDPAVLAEGKKTRSHRRHLRPVLVCGERSGGTVDLARGRATSPGRHLRLNLGPCNGRRGDQLAPYVLHVFEVEP